ncbi:MAG: 50S ribosomal protein L25 [Chloroflexota bacterium]|nr:50S ribosomal protein L25 [Chloroflexota bacterium]
MQRIPIVLKPREALRKKVRRLRSAGVTPVHLYGASISPMTLQATTKELVKTLTLAGKNTLLTVTVEGQQDEHPAFVREIQWDPVRGELLHVDFLRVDLTEKMRADVPLELTGEAPAIREFRGTLAQYLHSIEVEALPLDIPHSLTLDVSVLINLEVELRVRDIAVPQNVTIVTDADELVARVEIAKVEVTEAPVAEAEAAEGEAEAATEGEATDGAEKGEEKKP